MTVPANNFVAVTPGVLVAGGAQLDLNGMVLDNSTRVPLGTVASFSSAAAVANYFGAASTQAAIASTYFAGFDNSDAKPGAMLWTQYNQAAVAAYLRGGNISTLTLTQLQAITGSLSVTIDGVVKSGTINLAAATSFSNAAELIGQTLGIEGVQGGTGTASVGGTFTCTSSGTTLTVSAVLTGSLQPGDVVSGTDGTNSLPGGTTIVSQLTGATGGTGTYQLSASATPGNLSSCTVTSSSTVLHVTAVATGSVGIGDVVTLGALPANTYISAQISGTTGAVGNYQLSGTGHTIASGAATFFTPGVTYDSVLGALTIWSGTTGPTSTITFATGAVTGILELTQATGAVLSQGANAATPAAFMTALTAISQNWATFWHDFDPDGGSGNTNKLAFALWTSQQNNRWCYVVEDTDLAPSASSQATSSLGYTIRANTYSGSCVIWKGTTTGQYYAAFIMGAVASIDFEEINGRTDLAYRSQAGLAPAVTDPTVMGNLIANGYNMYLAAATANQGFNFFWNGAVSGPFLWLDSYVNQIWMNANFQLDLMELLTSAKSIPYNPDGNTQIVTSLKPTIDTALQSGVIRTNVALSANQAASVNSAAGKNVSGTIQTRGWYLQVLPASPSVRAARATPPVNFWYTDGQSVQQINMSSIEIQ